MRAEDFAPDNDFYFTLRREAQAKALLIDGSARGGDSFYLQSALAAGGDLPFTFDADFNDWLVFYMNTVLLTIGTLGIAYFFYGYRKWAFFVRRLEVHGGLELHSLRRIRAGGPGDAEGLADAFEIGAF